MPLAPVDFGFTETQLMVRDQLREFVTERIVGENHDWDAEDTFPSDVYGDFADLGLLGLCLPEEAGGEGFDPLTAGLIYEELGRGDVGLAMLAMAENIVNGLVWEYGNETQRDVIREAVRGETHVSFGLTEPGQGSDAQNIDTIAEPADDGWVLSGEKTASRARRSPTTVSSSLARPDPRRTSARFSCR